MSNQRTDFPTTSHLQNPRQIHDDSEQPENLPDEALRTTDNSFASQRPANRTHNASGAGTSNSPSRKRVSQSRACCQPGQGPDVTRQMDKTQLYHAAGVIARDPQPVLALTNMECTLLRMVSIDPPVTIASLGELNLERIRLDPKLRHDLNFDRDVSFRPNYDGQRGAIKKELSQRYWAVLSIELGYYMRVAARLDAEPIKDCLEASGMTWRIQHMFNTIRAILLTLVQKKDAHEVYQMLDIGFVMQQLNHGVCDLVGLGEWLGRIIKSSCSPVRDAAATSVVEHIRESVLALDPVHLVGAIEQLFCVLETMKLDVANHQIRGLRVKMIADTVPYCRDYFGQLVLDRGEEYRQAIKWFDYHKSTYEPSDQYEECEQYATKTFPGLTDLEVLTRAIVAEVTLFGRPPKTFTFDQERICEGQLAFEALRIREAVVDTLQQLRSIIYPACARTVAPHICQNLFRRMAQLDPGFHRTSNQLEKLPEDILVEIVRAAYESFGHSSPVHFVDHIGITANLLRIRLDTRYMLANEVPENMLAHEIHENTSFKFENLTLQEMHRMASMDELEIHNYCERIIKPNTTSSSLDMATGRGEIMSTSSRGLEVEASRTHEDNYRILAVKIAHITVLHWRVWGPILYEKEWPEDDENNMEYDEDDEGEDDLAGDTVHHSEDADEASNHHQGEAEHDFGRTAARAKGQ